MKLTNCGCHYEAITPDDSTPPVTKVTTTTITNYSGTFVLSLLEIEPADNQGIATGPTQTVNYTVSVPRKNTATLQIDAFTITIPAGGNYVYAIRGLIPDNLAPSSAKYINFDAGHGIVGHVFRDGSVRYSGAVNTLIPAGTYNLPKASVTYTTFKLPLAQVPNYPIAQGLTNATLNEGIFDPTPSSPNSIDNLEYFSAIYKDSKIYAAWGDNSVQIKGSTPVDPYTRVTFAVLNEDGTYVMSPKNIGDIPTTVSPPYPTEDPSLKRGAQMEVSLTIDPTNPLKMNLASWSIENTTPLAATSNFKAFYARSDDGGVTWQVLDLFAQNFVPKLQQDSITGDHVLRYDKFGNLFYEALGGYYKSLPFNGSNILNLRPLPDFYYSSNNGQTFDEILKGLPIHNDAFGLDYPETTVSTECDGSSVFWLIMKQIATFNEAFETGDTFPQLAFAIKMNGLHQFDSIRYIELSGTTFGGYGSMASGTNGDSQDIIATGIPVKGNYGSLFQSQSAIWFSYNSQGFSGQFGDVKFFANSNIGYRGVFPPQPSRESWAQPFIATDANNRWYVTYVDGPPPTSYPILQSDIWLIYSDDLGRTWSPPYKVNSDSRYTRFQPRISIDSTTNNLLVAWLDARDNTDAAEQAVLVRPYYAIFPDGFFPTLKKLNREFTSESAPTFFG